ncbi:unnamed protein product [Lactuca saligna]|uniref:Uncharacterized protein n=1 Tax=Lactuca saligna TaxID=75948 RepID=A0AA35YWJ3_LACSI|nr:unnamed protein product [Lactuca saligna]
MGLASGQMKCKLSLLTLINPKKGHEDTQSDICNEEDHNEEVYIEEVHNEEVHHEDVRNNGDTICNEGHKLTPQETPILNEFVPSPPPSSTTTNIQITISPWPPPISTPPQATIPLSVPIFTESTPPSTISATPVVSVNASDAGAGISGFTTTHVSPPISPCRTDNPYMIYGDGEDDLQGCTFSPVTIRSEVDDDTPVTKGQLQAIHDKLDSLLQASKPSDDYSQASVKTILETLTKEHSSNIEKMTTAMDESTKSNTTAANEDISSLSTSLKFERANFKDIRTGLKEKATMKSCVYDVTALLSDLIEAMYQMISLNVRKHLGEKLRHVFAILHRLEGYSESSSIPKQGGISNNKANCCETKTKYSQACACCQKINRAKG